MKKNIYIIILLLLSIFNSYANNDIEKLRERFIKQQLELNVNDKEINSIINSISKDGTWPNIDYKDVSRTGFLHTIHLDYLVKMARAYKSKKSSFYDDTNLRKKFDIALDFWLENDFRCDNWWNNEIGTPNAFISLLFIMDQSLTENQRNAMLSIARRANLNAWGARPSGDRIKIAGMQAKTELFCRNKAEFENTIKVIESEMKLVPHTERGIQSDYSFHHRPDRVNNTLSYGLDYINAFTEWAYNLRDTKFAFSDKIMRIAIDYYLDGVCKQMVYGCIEDPGIKNRDITRKQDKIIFSSVTPDKLMKITDYRHEELNNIVKAREGEILKPISFAKFFWQSEHFAFQRPNFYTSVRMFSSRNKNMEEAYNGEGLMNHFRGDGANYLSINGTEYFNLAPVYDWSCIPGATTLLLKEIPSEKEIQKYGTMNFVGGVTDGVYGAAAFDFISPHNSLKAKKSWFFFDDSYVCLGSNIESNSKNSIVTTVNQCRLNGKVILGDINGNDNILKKDSDKTDYFSWIWHNGVGYVFPEKQLIYIQNKTVKGNWFKVNHQSSSSKSLVTDSIFKVLIEHGNKPKNEKYSYLVLPNIKNDSISKYIKENPIRILSNDDKIQCVEHIKNNILYATCYKECKLQLGYGRGFIEVQSPSMYMVKFDSQNNITSLTVSDPSRELRTLNILITGKLEPNNKSLLKYKYNPSTNITKLSIPLPNGEYAGKSITVSFNN